MARTLVLRGRNGQRMAIADVPTTGAELLRLYKAGRLPWPIREELEVPVAARLARALPQVRQEGLYPVGYGVFPPLNAEPVVTLAKAVRDGNGKPVPVGARGQLACLWHARNGSTVFRLWFRSEEKGHRGKLLRGPVDCYEDVIGGVMSLAGLTWRLTGWEISRLDHGMPTALEDLGRDASGLVDAHGKAFDAVETPKL